MQDQTPYPNGHRGETTYVEAHNKPQVAKHLANLSIDWITQGCILGWLGSKRRKEGEKKL